MLTVVPILGLVELKQKALDLMVFGGMTKHYADALMKKISELVDDRPIRDLELFKT